MIRFISKIAHLREVGVFRNFDWGNDLPQMGRYNLFYGWNGTGKTTLSRVCRELELRRVPATGQVSLVLDGLTLEGKDFPQATIPIRVFNRDFVNESVFPSGGRDVPPILIVGRENVERQKEVDRKRGELSAAEQHLSELRVRKTSQDAAFDKSCIERAKLIKEMLRSSGTSIYNNYDKTNYKSLAEKILVDGDKATKCLDQAKRDELIARHHSIPKPTLDPISYTFPNLHSLADSVNRIVTTTVVARVIETLKNDPSLSAWVQSGFHLHRDRKETKCLYCEQQLPARRMSDIESHFSAQHDTFVSQLDVLIADIQLNLRQATALALPKSTEFYDDIAHEYEAGKQILREAMTVVINYLKTQESALEEKRGRIFGSMSFDLHVPILDGDAVGRVNDAIRKHNEVTTDFQNRVADARAQLEAATVADELEEYCTLRDQMKEADSLIVNAEETTSQLRRSIEHLEREIVEHRQPAEELNEDLKSYLGHGELQLAIKDTGYSILRNDRPASALSEGETTAIALLYFLKSLFDRRFDLAKGVVVLDDPVSSLDTNALYLAFGFIRARTQNAGQLIILTHNFMLFRQVRNWFRHLPNPEKKTAGHFMLCCSCGTDGRTSTILKLDKLLAEYESEYHYLFALIYREAKSANTANLEERYKLPNVARRLLESFLAFRQPHVSSSDLWAKMKDLSFDESKKIQILRFVDEQSHNSIVGESSHDLSILGESGSALLHLLEFIEAIDRDHYEAMVKLIRIEEALDVT